MYNPSQFKQTFSPASTFKICNSLIGLETGVITDENFVINWDSIIRQNANWNKDQDLKSAFKNSTVWYYQDNQLPFSQRSMDIVKNIMITKDTLGYVMRSKTGWGTQNGKDVGWYIGYIETKDNVYYFVNCIQSSDLNNNNFANARIEITHLILDDLKLRQN